ncbi:5'-methylthioadenosine phosphorylase [Leifsonia sp. AK011]|uniref:MTAP family purine nucleoside phosphorylase n=1 Tax=Leifsonia sp. AK011 TaxID=2723075 RepID=UPI0015CD9120|nr:MTAP family purine nucleoside phosphorylase [Leifsonia sp. AK011]NYF11422.1 5'-methylthioadenosine phosphorylase [Leifsonia sp. AK011]
MTRTPTHGGPAPLGIIGGSGLYSLFDPDASLTRVTDTPYGQATLTFGTLAGRDAVFLPRHGAGHTVPPHRINFRANVWALASVGVRAIVSTAAVGAVSPDYPIDSLALVDQYLDRTYGRADTFFDGDHVQHLPSADPFCPVLRKVAIASLGPEVRPTATVAVIQGPRFSTRAESLWFREAGAHLVNMTLYPEVPLAAELGMGTVTLVYVTDNDATPGDTVTADAVLSRLRAAQPRIIGAIESIAAAIPADYAGRELIDRAEIDLVLAGRAA